MGNPILERMKRPTSNQNDIMNVLQMAKENPDALFDNMMRTNPQFKNFVEGCKGKSPEQIVKHYGIDLEKYKHLLR